MASENAKKQPKEQWTVSLTEEQAEQVLALARERGTGETRAQVMRTVVDAGLRALRKARKNV